MSRLLIITRPTLAVGFQLGGVDAYGAEDVETAQEIIATWLESGETGLLAIDDGLFMKMDRVFVKRLEASDQLHFLTIPGGQPLGLEASRRHRITQMIRRAIGFHITFKGERDEVEE